MLHAQRSGSRLWWWIASLAVLATGIGLSVRQGNGRQALMPPVAWQYRTGDLVFRASHDDTSRSIRWWSGLFPSRGKAPGLLVSHVGMVVKLHGQAAVADVSPFGGGVAKAMPVARFVGEAGTERVVVMRPDEALDATRIDALAERFVDEKRPFDFSLDLRDDRALYCSEMALRLLVVGEAGGTAGVFRHRLDRLIRANVTLAPSDMLAWPELQRIAQWDAR